MAAVVIHWRDKDIPNMEIRNAVYKGGDSSIARISSGDNEYWFDWQECCLLEFIASHSKAEAPYSGTQSLEVCGGMALQLMGNKKG